MKTNKTFGSCSGPNRTPFHQVHLAKSMEIVNELGNPICSVEIDDIPKAIQSGNAQTVLTCLNQHDALLEVAMAAKHHLAYKNGTYDLECALKNLDKVISSNERP
jgi:hypothetical protein